MPNTQLSSNIPLDFNNVEPIVLGRGSAYLEPSWYKVVISKMGYMDEHTDSNGERKKPYATWTLTVTDNLDTAQDDTLRERQGAIGKAVNDIFGYGQARNFGVGRLMAALAAVRGKTPQLKDGSPYKGVFNGKNCDGLEVLVKVDDNEWPRGSGKISTRVQEYANLGEEPRIRRELATAAAIRAKLPPDLNRGPVGVPEQLDLPEESTDDAMVGTAADDME